MSALGFVGVGKVAQTLAALWQARGVSVAALYNRTPAPAHALASEIGAQVMNTPHDVVAACDLVFLTVSDDAIEPLARQLSTGDVRGKAFVHTSGARGVDVLASLAAAGAAVAGLHPSFPFADVATARRELLGGTFALETAHSGLKKMLQELVEKLEGRVLVIPEGKKAQYHLALVLASNYTVTLYSLAERLLLELGAQDQDARAALHPLLQATVKNIITQGVPKALTGPLTRADVGTLKAHLSVIEHKLLREAYKQLARLSYPMLEARGVPIQPIETLFREDDDDAPDNS